MRNKTHYDVVSTCQDILVQHLARTLVLTKCGQSQYTNLTKTINWAFGNNLKNKIKNEWVNRT